MKKYAVLMMSLCTATAYAQEVPSLSPVVARVGETLTFATDAEEAKQAVQKTQGGINIIEPNHIKGNLYTLRDVLNNQPGITTTEFFGGNDNPVISIRGSGLNSAPPDRGIFFLENGLPLNEADGTYYPGALDARNAASIIVRRGAAALNPGLDVFGGEVDFYNQDGRTETGALSVGIGSYATRHMRAAVGGVSGNWDWHISGITSGSDGFRHHNKQYRHTGKINIGYQSGSFENRTILSYANQSFEIPGPQTLDQLYEDPRSVANAGSLPNYIIWATDPSRNNKTWRVANISHWQTETTTQSFGVYYQHTKDYFKAPPRMLTTDSNTYGAQYKLEARIHPSFTLGAMLSYAKTDTTKDAYIRKEFVNAHIGSGVPLGAKIGKKFGSIPPSHLTGGATNFAGQIFANWDISPQWALQGQLRYTHTTREFNLEKESVIRRYSWVSPRLGVSYKPSENHLLYASVSAHREVPSMSAYLSSYTPMSFNQNLDIQKAVSFEVGARGNINQNYSYDIAVYRMNLKNEFLTTPDPLDPTNEVSTNYRGKTYHQGVELGLKGKWSLGRGNGDLKASAVYTLNDFKFSSGYLKGNQISGVPRHVLMLMLSYENGPWSVGVNSRSALGKMAAGNDNKLYVGGYTVYGAKITYAANANLDFYLQGDNLGNKKYVAWTFSGGTVNRDSLYFLAGYGRSISAGMNLRF